MAPSVDEEAGTVVVPCCTILLVVPVTIITLCEPTSGRTTHPRATDSTTLKAGSSAELKARSSLTLWISASTSKEVGTRTGDAVESAPLTDHRS